MPPFQYFEAETPCPAKWSRPSEQSRSSFNIYDDNDDTAAIDFTTDFRSIPTTMQENPRRVKRAAAFKIHEDGAANKTSGLPAATWRKSMIPTAGSSMLTQPAQRLPSKQRVTFAVDQSPRNNRKERTERRSTAPKEKPLSESRAPPIQEIEQVNTHVKEGVGILKKDKRRGTIYIPSDDITMPTMFMSIFSPLKAAPVEGDDVGVLETRISKQRHRAKQSPKGPEKLPLQQPLHIAQESASPQDIAGPNTGKENIPPGSMICTGKNEDTTGTGNTTKSSPLSSDPLNKKLEDLSLTKDSPKQKSRQCRRKSDRTFGILRPSCPNSPKTRVSTGSFKATTAMIQDKMAGKSSAKPANVVVKTSPLNRKQRAKQPEARQPIKKKTPPRQTVPRVPKVNIQYPLLTEDISKPYMYEENWLAHQEIVITQLVNGLFDSAHRIPAAHDTDSLRHELLGHYQDAYFSLLYKRVQASLLYGTLRIPKDVLSRGNRLTEDIGMRRKFLNLWLNTYNLSALAAAAETVIGRKIIPAAEGTPSQKALPDKALRRLLEGFLETCLLRNEDLGPDSRTKLKEDEMSPYCRTLLRSIMMVLLLDRAREMRGTILPRCLFIPSSEYKSSTAVLQALCQVVLPTVGDITRALNHLDCQVSYEQCPLEEHNYRITNLAVDLRDGILLTRLVELLLLFSEESDPDQRQGQEGGSEHQSSPVTREEEWPLSRSLKVPCVSRVTKLFNVQVALNALSRVRRIETIVKDIRPEDIVDGYREKTIAVLWGLVGKWGLPGLLDWSDLKREISRLEKKTNRVFEQGGSGENEVEKQEECDIEYEQEADLLRNWASYLARLKGLRLENLTTSFADGRIFESIVDEYEPLISDGRVQSSQKVSLAQRLRGLGCSSQFASLVAPSGSTATHIFDKDFTLGALAFLCSRLLLASRRVRAAIVIQCAWREVMSRRQSH